METLVCLKAKANEQGVAECGGEGWRRSGAGRAGAGITGCRKARKDLVRVTPIVPASFKRQKIPGTGAVRDMCLFTDRGLVPD